ncbi:MAG: DUF1501 domain-containing protein, partial [Planctomycetota bacterium]
MSRRYQPPRRTFLADMGMGFTGLALGAMLHSDGFTREASWTPPNGLPHFPAKAKRVIWLFMNGGVSHMESFDPKPMISTYGGKTINETPYADVQNADKLAIERAMAPDANGQQRNTLFPLQVGFKRHGQSGIEVSDWFPHIAKNIDRIAVVRSMWTTDSNHMAQTQFHSGRNMLDGEFPTLGAWVHYGLGSLNDNLPQFISIGTREYWNKKDGLYLGPAHDAVPLRIDPSNPLDFGKPELPFSREAQAVGFDLIESLNRQTAVEYPNDPATAARVASYELAFRMQRSVPEVLDFSGETAETKALYGLDLPHCREFGTQLLAARRFAERGVRFIQIQHG